MEPRIFCLCPTYCRPEVLATSVFLFEKQTYNNKVLYILDDAGEFVHCRGKDWILISFDKRFPSLPSKYNYLFNMLKEEMKDDDIVAVWEDDDLYLPRYLEAVEIALRGQEKACKHFTLYSWYQDKLLKENGLGNTFHSCIALKAGLLKEMGGWIETDIAAFDVKFLEAITHLTNLADSSKPCGIQFVYRFSGLKYHGSCFMRHPFDTFWYERVGQVIKPQHKNLHLKPHLDPLAKSILTSLGYGPEILERT